MYFVESGYINLTVEQSSTEKIRSTSTRHARDAVGSVEPGVDGGLKG